MFSRASSSLYWPRFRDDINKFQTTCKTCRKIAPSNPTQPSTQKPDIPSYPFESIVADFFSLEGRNYLAVADRYSNWLSVLKLVKDDSQHLIQALREYIPYFGIPRLFSSDGASIFTSEEMEDFCKRWGIEQRVSSSYYPVSNKRAEVAVKSSKRLVRDNLNSDGSLNCDRFARALLIHRNTPDPTTGVSPAQILYGRQLRDHIPTPPHKFALQSNWEKANYESSASCRGIMPNVRIYPPKPNLSCHWFLGIWYTSKTRLAKLHDSGTNQARCWRFSHMTATS